jgi:Arc/MetJ-type ribon-helix-helix transcriptional regulator
MPLVGMNVVVGYHVRVIPKQRLSASVDADLIEAAEAAVAGGRFDSVSAWVNDALRLKLEQDRRLQALGAFVAAYEVEHGEITPEEIRDAARRARGRAVTVRPMLAKRRRRATRRRS